VASTPALTPDVLRQAEEMSVREGVSLPVAIGRLTGWRVYTVDGSLL
jgi:hypothetical protein